MAAAGVAAGKPVAALGAAVASRGAAKAGIGAAVEAAIGTAAGAGEIGAATGTVGIGAGADPVGVGTTGLTGAGSGACDGGGAWAGGRGFFPSKTLGILSATRYFFCGGEGRRFAMKSGARTGRGSSSWVSGAIGTELAPDEGLIQPRSWPQVKTALPRFSACSISPSGNSSETTFSPETCCRTASGQETAQDERGTLIVSACAEAGAGREIATAGAGSGLTAAGAGLGGTGRGLAATGVGLGAAGIEKGIGLAGSGAMGTLGATGMAEISVFGKSCSG